MKAIITFLLLTAVILFHAHSAYSQETHEQKLENEINKIEEESQNEEGKKSILERMKSQFNVDDQRVQSLLDQNLGYGDLAVIFSLASEMPEGITDENIKKILALRQGTPQQNWTQVAESLGINLERVRSQLNHIRITPPIEQTRAILDSTDYSWVERSWILKICERMGIPLKPRKIAVKTRNT